MGAPGLWAQGTADIVGTVTDNSGSVVPMAKVTAKNVETNLMRTQADRRVGSIFVHVAAGRQLFGNGRGEGLQDVHESRGLASRRAIAPA